MLHDLFPNWPRSKAHRCKEVASCTNHWPGMVLPNICMSQDMFCIFMWLSVEIYINYKNSSSNLDLKTCFLRIYISFSFVSYRQSMCLFVCFFFHHWGLCFLGGHNYSLSRQNGGLIWGFPRWLKRCMGVVTSHCVSLGLLGSKKCVSFFFHFCAKYAHMCIDENLAWFNQSCNFFQQISTTDHQSTPLF